MRLMTVIAAGLIAAASYAAEAQTIHMSDGFNNLDYFVPENSPVKFLSKGPDFLAKFQGQFTMSGTYYYGTFYAGPMTRITDDELELYFIPDKGF